MEVPLGDIVGFRHRDEDTTTDVTHLEIHADGKLLIYGSLSLQFELTTRRYFCCVG